MGPRVQVKGQRREILVDEDGVANASSRHFCHVHCTVIDSTTGSTTLIYEGYLPYWKEIPILNVSLIHFVFLLFG